MATKSLVAFGTGGGCGDCACAIAGRRGGKRRGKQSVKVRLEQWNKRPVKVAKALQAACQPPSIAVHRDTKLAGFA